MSLARRRSHAGWPLAIPLALMLAGCGGASGGVHLAAPGNGSGPTRAWVAAGSNEAMLIQWTQDGDSLTGEITDTTLTGESPPSLHTDRVAFTGQTVDGSITLTIPQGFGLNTNLTGSLASDSLTLNLLNNNGIISPLKLSDATVQTYDHAVASLQQSINQSKAAMAAGQVAAAQASAQAEANARHAAAQQEQSYESSCRQHGGDINADKLFQFADGTEYPGCVVTYPGDDSSVDEYLPLNEDGTIDQSRLASNHAECDSDIQEAQQGAQEGVPWRIPPVWHSNTGVCAYGQP